MRIVASTAIGASFVSATLGFAFSSARSFASDATTVDSSVLSAEICCAAAVLALAYDWLARAFAFSRC